jgi:hypothetical protein
MVKKMVASIAALIIIYAIIFLFFGLYGIWYPVTDDDAKAIIKTIREELWHDV